jgi:hypothetical protein
MAMWALEHARVAVVAAALGMQHRREMAGMAAPRLGAVAVVGRSLAEALLALAVPALVVKSGSSATHLIPPEAPEHAAILW